MDLVFAPDVLPGLNVEPDHMVERESRMSLASPLLAHDHRSDEGADQDRAHDCYGD